MSIDHSAVWIRVIKAVSLLNTPICLHNIADVYKKAGSNKQFWNAVCAQTQSTAHIHTGHCPTLNEACDPTHWALLLKTAATGWVSQS